MLALAAVAVVVPRSGAKSPETLPWDDDLDHLEGGTAAVADDLCADLHGSLAKCAFMAATICSVRLKRHRRQLGLSHSLFLTTHLKPTWLVDVSTGSAWRAAGR